MKISTITFHNTSNFGATLQCVALFQWLTKRGHEVEIINYLPKYISDKKSVSRDIKKIKGAKDKQKAIIKGIAYFMNFISLKRRDFKFESFLNENVNLSCIYTTPEALKNNPPSADLYICGSDQIWNPSLTGGRFDDCFFLQFTKGKKVAYGVSFGEFDIDANADELRQLLKSFSDISVREASSAKRLSSILHREVSTVLDCTLLLDKADYNELEVPVKKIRQPYLLLYNIQNSSVAVALAKKIAKEKKLIIIDISPNPFVKIAHSQKMIDIGPGEFLYLFHWASYVITNSFHGTLFSIIYEKQFITIPHSLRARRVIDLLEKLDLKSRIALESGYIDPGEISYDIIHNKVMTEREMSYGFLNKILFSTEESYENLFALQEFKQELPEKKKPPILVAQRAMCCGCGACMNICKQNAIEMSEDAEGFLYPHVNSDRCIKCYMCLKVCAFKEDLPF